MRVTRASAVLAWSNLDAPHYCEKRKRTNRNPENPANPDSHKLRIPPRSKNIHSPMIYLTRIAAPRFANAPNSARPLDSRLRENDGA